MVAKSNIKSKSQQYSYSEVMSITNDLKTIIGEGGFGSVYLGSLEGDTKVAVKFLRPSSNQGYKEFQAEVRFNTASSLSFIYLKVTKNRISSKFQLRLECHFKL